MTGWSSVLGVIWFPFHTADRAVAGVFFGPCVAALGAGQPDRVHGLMLGDLTVARLFLVAQGFQFVHRPKQDGLFPLWDIEATEEIQECVDGVVAHRRRNFIPPENVGLLANRSFLWAGDKFFKVGDASFNPVNSVTQR